MNKRLFARISTIVVTGAVVIVGLGQGCGKFTVLGDQGSDSAQNSSGEGDDPGIKPNTSTVSLVYGKQILDQMSSCIGSGLATERTLGMYDSKKGTISETGAVKTLTAPMLMASASIAGEVCKDLIENEKIAARIFIGVNFNGTTLPDAGSMQDAMRRIARSCWSRDEEPEEGDIILGAIQDAFQGANAANKAHDAALFMCATMLSSLDALVLQ